MAKTADIGLLLHRYLKLLTVEVSGYSLCKLLDTPMGTTLRGISDALDRLHVRHDVYRLPATYLQQIELPFLAALKKGEFCLIQPEGKDRYKLVNPQGKEITVNSKQLATVWEGILLVAEKPELAYREPHYRIRQAIGLADRYKTIGLCVCLALLSLCTDDADKWTMLFKLLTLAGLAVGLMIVYKESYAHRFLQRFCKIGEAVDCNRILHSRAATFGGLISLGELATVYYAALVLYTLNRGMEPGSMVHLTVLIAVGFTLFSVIYQVVIAHKFCMLCMVLNVIIWLQAVVWGCSHPTIRFSLHEALLFLAAGGSCLTGWYIVKSLLADRKRYEEGRLQKQALLRHPELFDRLLDSGETTPPATKEITLANGKEGEKTVQLVIGLHCAHCARSRKDWMQLPAPVHLVFAVTPDKQEEANVAAKLIACYLKHGYAAAMEQLRQWYETETLPDITATPEAEALLQQQIAYCRQHRLTRTPTVTINGKLLPDIYTIEDLRYLL